MAPSTFARVVRRMFANGAMDFAVQLAYFLLLFLFPFFMFLVNVTNVVVTDPAATIERLLANTKDYLPSPGVDMLRDYLSSATQNTTPTVFALSALFTFAAGLSAVQHIIRAADSAYGIQETRPLWKRLGIAILLVFGFALFVAAILFLVLSPQAETYLQQAIGLPGAVAVVLRWVIAFLGLTLAFAVLYKVGPNAELPFSLVGAAGLITTVFLIIASEIFTLWATYLFRPTQLYGQLGGGIVILLWLFGIGLVVRFGIEIDAELARVEEELKSSGEP